MTTESIKSAGGISAEGVKAKTGKTWDEWLTLLDADGAMSMAHKDIAMLVHEKYGIPGWWAQTSPLDTAGARKAGRPG